MTESFPEEKKNNVTQLHSLTEYQNKPENLVGDVSNHVFTYL